MADQTYIPTGFAGLTQATRLRASAVTPARIGGRGGMKVNPNSLAVRCKG